MLLVVGLCFSVFFNSSCSSIQSGMYRIFMEGNSGDHVLENEKYAKTFLENILEAPYNFIMNAYERTLFRWQLKRTRLLKHSYYLITNINSGESDTLSYYGTKFAFYSTGAWTKNGNNDFLANSSYTSGNKRWGVAKIDADIDIEATIINILEEMDSGITYYYRAHVKPKTGFANCNTALWDTLVRK